MYTEFLEREHKISSSRYKKEMHTAYNIKSEKNNLESQVYAGKIIDLDFDTELDLNYDEEREKIKLSVKDVAVEGYVKYSIQIGSCIIEQEAEWDEVYSLRAARLNYRDRRYIYLLVGRKIWDREYEEIYFYGMDFQGNEILQWRL